MKSTGKRLWKILSGVSFAGAVCTLYCGLDKMFLYANGESVFDEMHNAYVGGDAYNYIINGTYSTAFFVLTAMFALMGIGFIALWYLSVIAATQRSLSDTCNITNVPLNLGTGKVSESAPVESSMESDN